MGVGLAFKGAAHGRLLNNWIAPSLDVNDAWWEDGRTIADRSWDLYQNNPYARAMVETIIGGTFGANGLTFRSLYSEDDNPQVSDHELQVRRQINKYVSKVVRGTRADVSGVMTWAEMHRALNISRRVTGDGIAIRLFRPDRKTAVAGTCWRLVDPARVCNPNYGANSKTMFEGFELDSEGSPIAIHVISTHPNLMRYAETKTWTRIPIIADDGTRNVIHRRAPGRPDQIRGVGSFSSVMEDLKHLGDLKLATVVAKKAQASIAYFINTKDPRAAAASDRNGAMINGAVGIKPLMKYYLNSEDKITSFNFQFQGGEFDDLLVSILQGASATWRLPVEIVLRRLTKTSLSSSRAALLDYYQTCQAEQDEHIEQAYNPMIAAIIVEGVARGEIEAPTDDMDRLTLGRYLRPARIWPDPLKEAQAAKAWIGVGRSPSSVFAEAGFSYDDEISQTRQDEDYADAQGVEITDDAAAVPGATQAAPVAEPATATDDTAKEVDPEAPAESLDEPVEAQIDTSNLKRKRRTKTTAAVPRKSRKKVEKV